MCVAACYSDTYSTLIWTRTVSDTDRLVLGGFTPKPLIPSGFRNTKSGIPAPARLSDYRATVVRFKIECLSDNVGIYVECLRKAARRVISVFVYDINHL